MIIDLEVVKEIRENKVKTKNIELFNQILLTCEYITISCTGDETCVIATVLKKINDSARLLNTAINSCTTIEELDAIVDDRTPESIMTVDGE